MKRRPINFAAFDWICAESISLYISEFFRLLLSSVRSSINTSNPVPLEAMLMPSHWSTRFHRWCFMLWIMSCSKPSPYFFLPFILVQVDLNFSHPKNTFPEMVWLFFRCFLAKSNLALFAPCGEPSGLWQWHVCLLESVLLLDGCCERVFLYHGEDPPIIHHCCPPWISRPFYVAELTSAFFFFSECTKLLIWPP